MRVNQIKDDAAMVAAPVANLDRAIQQAHDQRLETLGLSLLTAASFYLPALGVALLALSAWHWLGDIFEAVEAWQEGDTLQALDHVGHVAADLAVIAGTAAGVTAAQRLWARSALVDSLSVARREDGTERLWIGDLAPYRSEPPPAGAMVDDAGVWRYEQKAWIAMDGHHYPVVQRSTDDHWQLQPRDGHGPLLMHNGAGAWRLWSEQPMQWRGNHYLCRRLGGPLAQLDDQQIDQLLAIHDVQEEHLRAIHVLGRAPEAGLLDSAQRVLLNRRIRSLVNRLRNGQPVEDVQAFELLHGLPEALGLSGQALAELAWNQRRVLLQRLNRIQEWQGSEAEAALLRVFPSLNRRVAQSLLAKACAAERDRLLATGRLQLGLAEAARGMLLPVRMARVYEALYWDTPQGLDLARVALRMLEHLSSAASGIRWRLFDGVIGEVPLASMGDGETVCNLVYQDGVFQRFDVQAQPVGKAGELFEVMSSAYGNEQRELWDAFCSVHARRGKHHAGVGAAALDGCCRCRIAH